MSEPLKPGPRLLSLSLQEIATSLDKVIADLNGEPTAFLLVVFPKGRAEYVANCERPQAVAQLRALLEYWDKGMPDVPTHKIQG